METTIQYTPILMNPCLIMNLNVNIKIKCVKIIDNFISFSLILYPARYLLSKNCVSRVKYRYLLVLQIPLNIFYCLNLFGEVIDICKWRKTTHTYPSNHQYTFFILIFWRLTVLKMCLSKNWIRTLINQGRTWNVEELYDLLVLLFGSI